MTQTTALPDEIKISRKLYEDLKEWIECVSDSDYDKSYAQNLLRRLRCYDEQISNDD